jgi:hypothetical protein
VATAFYRGKLICSSQNCAGLHAEAALLQNHKMQRYRCLPITIFVARVGEHQTHSFSRPCANCSRALAQWNAKVYYTDEHGNWVRDHTLDNTYLSPTLAYLKSARKGRSQSKRSEG